MANSVYDDQQTDSIKDLERAFAGPAAETSGSDIADRNRQASDLEAAYNAPAATESGSKKLEEAKGLADKEKAVPAGDNSINYTGGKDNSNKKKDLLGGLFKRKRTRNIGIIVGIITTLIGGGSLLSFLNVFNLDTYLSAVESKAFVRYQVDMDGRSSKWIEAYIRIRLADIDDPGTGWKEDDNLYFRSQRVDNNNPLNDWYKTLRTSSFEKDVFEKHGIRFTSVATRENGSIHFRPAVVTVVDESYTMGPLTKSETELMDRVTSGNFSDSDLNTFNDKLGRFAYTTTFDSDKAARKAIKEAVNKEIDPWQWMKRRHIRKDIQNMTGVRSWKFFENTRNKISENIIDMRNRFLIAVLPDDTKSGKFMLCLFGVSDCKLSSDPADPSNRQVTPDPNSPKEGGAEHASGDGKTNVTVSDGTAGDITQSAVATSTGEAATDVADNSAALLTKKITQQIIGKLNTASGIIQVIDSLSKIDQTLGSKKLSEMVTLARSTQAMGFYTTLAIARDQIKTGEINSSEYDQFMEMISGIGNNEIWSKISENTSASSVSAAASSTQATTSDACSQESLAAMTSTSYTPLCSNFKIGASSNASDLENWWNTGLGKALHPVLVTYRNTIGPLVTITNEFTSTLLTPLTNTFKALLEASGLQSTINDALGWATSIIAQQLGAGPMVDNPTGSQIGLIAAEGTSATSESSMRYQGAALTTTTTQAQTQKKVALYLENQDSTESMYERYISLQNPSSFLSTELFAITQSGNIKNPTTFIASVIGSITNLPSSLLSSVSASDTTQTGYELAQLSGIETYDFPTQCTESDPFTMTPQSATNADELGIIPASELTWDLVNNKESFYARLYESGADTSLLKTVYDCGIFDTSVRGSLGAQYGYEDDNSIYATTSSSASVTSSDDLTNKTYLQSSSENIQCAAGTNDVGIHDGYVSGNVVKIRLCAIPGLPSTDLESVSGNNYSIAGANGLALVNAKASASVLKMVNDMKAAGLDISATSTFRSEARQASLYNSLGSSQAAPAGYSNHQMGYAIDFRISPGNQKVSSCKTVNGVCTPPSDPYGLYAWLTANANKYQYQQLTKEFWHWEAEGVSSGS